MKEIEAGQTIFVSANDFYDSEPNLSEYIVTDVNTVSFYAHKKDVGHVVRRFDKRKMKHKSIGNVYTAYLAEKEYWDEVNRANETVKLKLELKIRINDMSLDELRSLKEIISTK
ncbi:beta barrel domain-containing protein [Bacillus fungorum]|uniref:beta barrel domain-containing protein n=1 Tax=Bacillus fungorum TaxID=2039284 RepID=UPI003F563D4E